MSPLQPPCCCINFTVTYIRKPTIIVHLLTINSLLKKLKYKTVLTVHLQSYHFWYSFIDIHPCFCLIPFSLRLKDFSDISRGADLLVMNSCSLCGSQEGFIPLCSCKIFAPAVSVKIFKVDNLSPFRHLKNH